MQQLLNLKGCLSASVLVLACSAVNASPYISLAVGQGDGSDWTSTVDPAQAVTALEGVSKDTAYSAAIGQMFGDLIGAELNYTNLGKYNQSGVQNNSKAIGADVVLNLDVASLSLFGKAGVAYVHSETAAQSGAVNSSSEVLTDTERKIGPHYGVGVGYNLLAGVSVFSEYQAFKVNTSTGKVKINTTNIGVKLRF